MGNLARFGIAGGERVSVQSLGCLPVPIEIDDFAFRAIKELGFAAIFDKVDAGRALSRDDLQVLISRAPLSVLMKLVQVGARASARVEPTPIVAVSLADDRFRGSIEHLLQIEHRELEVLLEGVDLDGLGDGLEARVAEVAHSRGGLTVVGPAAEDILLWLQIKGRKSRVLTDLTLSRVIEMLRAAGVARLRACRDVSALSEVSSVGLGQSFCTALDKFENAAALAEHFHSIAELSGRDRMLSVWFPGLSRSCRVYPLDGAALDMMMLRMLAVGTIALPSVSRRRASSRYLSLEAFKVAHLCGANDFGFGAIDGATEHSLQLKQLGLLQSVVPAGKTGGGEEPKVK